MFIIYGIMLIAPILTAVIGSFIFDTPFSVFINEYGKFWVFVSPIWAAIIGVVAYFHGKTIEVVETAKFAVTTVQDNKHHVVNAAKGFSNFIKQRAKTHG